MAKRALLISTDLIFTSKITGTANALGLQVDVLGNSALLKDRVTAEEYECLIVDLAFPNVNPAELIAALHNTSVRKTIAFGAHVNARLLTLASEAGFSEVMPRSKFDATLADILRSNLE